MPLIEEIFFARERAPEMCYHCIDYFKSYKFYNRAKEVFTLTEYPYIDLSRRDEDMSHYVDGNVKKDDNVYFINILYSTSEKVVCDNNLGNIKLHFWNCVFNSYIKFTVVPKEIHFVNCVFLTKISFLNEYPITRLDFTDCSLKEFVISGSNIQVLSVVGSYFNNFKLESSQFKDLYLSGNMIDRFTIVDTMHEKLEFDPQQIVAQKPHQPFFVKRLCSAISDQRLSSEDMSFFKRIGRVIGWWPSDKSSQQIEDWRKRSRLETLNFLKKQTVYRYSSFARANIDYLQQKILFEDSLLKLVLWPLGYFLKPIRIMLLSLFVIGGYGFIYYRFRNLLEFGDRTCVKEFGDCLYFSGVTFLTIGYGDILPKVFLKWLAVSEGFMGVFISGLFVVVVTKRILSE